MFDAIINTASQTWNVPAQWIRAVIQVESSWNPDAYNPNDPSRGLMAITDSTGRLYGVVNPDDLFDPATNVDVGTHLLSDLRAKYGDDFRAVYSAYNSGSPTLWQTSAQVAANVARALAALADQVVASGGNPLVIVIAIAALWFWKKR